MLNLTIEQVENGFVLEECDEEMEIFRTSVFEDSENNSGVVRMLESIAVSTGCELKDVTDEGSIVVLTMKELMEFKEGKGELAIKLQS